MMKSIILFFFLLAPAWAFMVPKTTGLGGVQQLQQSSVKLQKNERKLTVLQIVRGYHYENDAITKAIDRVVNALRRDRRAQEELGYLVQVDNFLSHENLDGGAIRVIFYASFQKGSIGGMTRNQRVSEWSLANKIQERYQEGTMTSQVRATVDTSTWKVLQCKVWRDWGTYGRYFEMTPYNEEDVALAHRFPEGTKVALHELSARPEMNGLTGTVVGGGSRLGRVQVRLDDMDPFATPVAVRPENLEYL